MKEMFGVKLDEPLASAVKKAAEKAGVTVSEQVRRLLEIGLGALNGGRVVTSFKDGDERMTLIASTGSLPMDTVTPTGDVLADGGQPVFFSAIDGADKSGDTQALRDSNRPMKFDEYLPPRASATPQGADGDGGN